MSRPPAGIVVRPTRDEDFDGIIDLCLEVYPAAKPWSREQLASHLSVFPEGQFVAVEEGQGRIVGMAASLVVLWDDYEMTNNWRDFTNSGMFTNHDPERGRTLYAAEVMTRTDVRGRGIGKALYAARRDLVRRLRLLRIRAGSRLRGYHRHADAMSIEDYVMRVIHGEITDPTLTFQLRQGFEVLAVTPGYLRNDPESLGWAAVIEWLNQEIARPEDTAGRDPRFARRAP